MKYSKASTTIEKKQKICCHTVRDRNRKKTVNRSVDEKKQKKDFSMKHVQYTNKEKTNFQLRIFFSTTCQFQ